MRLLLTGSNGFLGARVVEDAHARGWQVVGVGRSAGPTSPVDHYLRHDLSHPLPDDAVPGTVDAVVHCAALPSPWATPRAYVAANVDATRHVARWAADHGAPHLVHVSSTSVLYRDEDQHGLTEDSPVVPDDEQLNAYTRTKSIAERIVAQYPGPHAVLRPRLVFGVGDTTLLPRILRLAQAGLLPVLEPPGGPPVHTDLIEVHTAAHYVTEAVERRAHGLYNLTNTEPVDIFPFLLDLLARLGVEPRPVHVPLRFVEAFADASELLSATLAGWREPPVTRFGVSLLSRSRTFDVSRAVRDLGAPAVSLDEGVERLVRAQG